jgi:hypothetical protein
VNTGAFRLPVPSSPRTRRRLGWSLAGLAVLCAIAAAAVLLPKGESPPPEVLRNGPAAQSAAAPAPLHLTKADRRAISALLARFVPAALGRNDLTAAYRLAAPAMRQGMSLEVWRQGNIPVFPYRAAARGFAGWRLNYAEGNEVNLDLLLQPALGSKQGAIVYTFDVRRIGGRWLVDSAVPTATYTPPGGGSRMLAQPDFGPEVPTAKVSKERLDARWLIVPGVLLALVVLVPVAFGVLHWRRSSLAYRRGVQRS